MPTAPTSAPASAKATLIPPAAGPTRTTGEARANEAISLTAARKDRSPKRKKVSLTARTFCRQTAISARASGAGRPGREAVSTAPASITTVREAGCGSAQKGRPAGSPKAGHSRRRRL